MDFLPPLRFSILNGWLLLVAYFIGLTISVLGFPADKRKKLFLEPQYPAGHPCWIILILGRVAAISFVVLTLFARLRLGTSLASVGLAVYFVGYAVVMLSLIDYKRVSTGQLATVGLYQYSRNPQWLGLAGVFVGTALAVGGWLHLLLVVLLIIAYHFQILLEEGICELAYGETYRDYKRRVPRYILV